jgi:hypothetical protein
MVKRATSPEDFNNAAARNVLKNWYEDNPLIRDRAWKTDKIFNKNIDEQLKGTSSSIGYPIRKQVQRMIHSGKTEGEIADALTKALGNLGTEFGNESGTFANSDMREEVAVVDLLVRNLQSQNPDVTGKTDDELNQAYSDFSAYLDRNLDKMFKDMPFENRKALVSHIKSDKDNVDKLIKEQAMNLLKQKGSDYSAVELVGELSGMDPSNLDMAIAGLYTISSDPNASAEDRSNYITNFDATAAEEQQDLKVNPPAATAATGDAADPAGGDAGIQYDPYSPREVHFQGRDGNFYRATYDPSIKEYTSAPTLVGEDVAQRAIAREDAIYGRNRADQLRDAATRRSQDLSDLSSLYDRQDSLYGRDIAREDALYGRDTARDDFIYGRNRADFIADRADEWAREDAIRRGNWTREDELMYRGRNWELQDIYDQRLYDEAQAAEDKTFRTAELGMQLAPTYMDSQLDAAKFEADILRNAGDYISAAFMQRGEPSPFTPVTQADMVNQYRKHVRDMMDATSAGFRSPYLEDTSWANIAPPPSAGEAPPPPPPAAPSAGAKPAGAAAPAAGSAKPDDTKPAASSAGAATTAPAGEGTGSGSPPSRTISPEELAARRSLIGGNMPGGFRTPTEPVGAEFGAVNFQPPEQPIFAPPAVGSEFGDGAFVPPEQPRSAPPPQSVGQVPSNQYPGTRPPPEYGMDPWNIRSQGWQPLRPDAGPSGRGPAPIANAPIGRPDTPLYDAPRAGQDIRYTPTPTTPVPVDPLNRSNLPPGPFYWETNYGGGLPRAGSVGGATLGGPSAGLPRAGSPPQAGDSSLDRNVPMFPEGPSFRGAPSQGNELGAIGFVPPEQINVPITGSVPSQIDDYYNPNVRSVEPMGENLGPLGDVSGRIANYALPRLGDSGTPPPQPMPMDSYDRLMDYGIVGGQQDMMSPAYGGLDRSAIQYPQSQYNTANVVPQPEYNTANVVPQPVQDFSEGFEFERVDQWPQNQYSPQYSPLQDFSEGFEFEQVDQWPVNEYSPPSPQFSTANVVPQPVPSFDEGLGQDFERVDLYPQTQGPSRMDRIMNARPQFNPFDSEGFDITNISAVENYPVSTANIDRMDRIMSTTPVERATGQQVRFGTQPLGFRPPKRAEFIESEFEIF